MFGGEEIGSIEQSHNRTIQQWEILQRLLPLEQVYETKAAIHGHEDVRPFVQSKDGTHWLADSGSMLTVIPAKPSDTEDLHSTAIAANGTRLRTYGRREVHIQFGRKTYHVEAVVARVAKPIIGADLLKANRLTVCYAKEALIDSANGIQVPFSYRDAGRLAGWAITKLQPKQGITGDPKFIKLAQSFPEIMSHDFRAETVKHGVVHGIDTGNATPCRTAPRPLGSGPKATLGKAAWMDLLEKGIIERCQSNWSSGLHLQPKPDGTYRPCGDFRQLNEKTLTDTYPIPHLRYFTAKLNGAKVFSKVDLTKAYHQIPIKKEDRHKTAITTPWGLFQFRRLAMGLCNAAQSFQKMIEDVLRDITGVFVYLDDILVYTQTEAEHERVLRELFTRLRDNGMAISPEKTILGAEQVNFVGYLVNANGITPLGDKVKAITDFPRPTTPKQTLRFCGMINYYRALLPRAAHIMQPLYTAGNLKPAQFKWGPELEKAFTDSKKMMTGSIMLDHPHPTAQVALTTDASETGMGAVLEQYIGGKWRPLGYWSRHLNETQQKWSPFELELYAVQQACRHFRPEIEGRNPIIFTDHQPLVYAIKSNTLPALNKCHRQLIEISQYTTNIVHLSGKDNALSDALSRTPPTEEVATIWAQRVSLETIDLKGLAKAQDTCPTVKAYREGKMPNGLTMCNVTFGRDVTLYCDTSTGTARPLVPAEWRKGVFSLMHNLTHMGPRATVRHVAKRYVWPEMSKQLTRWAQECHECQQSKTQRRIEPGVQDFEVPRKRFTVVHTDVVGPLPMSNGFKYVLTAIDRTTRYLVAQPMEDASAKSCAQAFIHGWQQHFGLPAEIVSDQGGTFTGELWEEFQKAMGTKPSYAPVYHQQANGMVERQHKDLKNALRCRLLAADRGWHTELPWVLMGLRNTFKPDLGASAAEMTFGSTMTIPGDLLGAPMQAELSQKEAKELLGALQRQADSWETKPHRHGGLPTMYYPETAKNATHVYVEREKHQAGAFGRRFEGPFPITRRIGVRQLEIQVGFTAKGEKRLEIQDIARCKIAHVATDQEIAKKKNPGRKPGPTKRKARARKQQKTAQLSPTAEPFIPTTSRPSRDINTASSQEPTESRQSRDINTASEDAGLPSSTPANPGLAGRPQRKRKKPARLID